ncbi:RNA 2',3'-cyclic phosphodiesterase [Amaricoccus sp.]|uniref:RNA 2',3'-cyclic phosphodiesterase n=1 Tax=Amaricoccus sp. TaxID=1872485 RepID=UPI001B3EA348|nr:RNA 2',3'-cyclic phosphodiesterase [Amaricoccus sp.]MBP7001739.1 RNA 2',3'-cyclic phosphodiesterase [Amaricoccus sp.]
MIRAFVSIAPPEEAVAALVAAQAGMPAGRLVEAESLHLTLAFLGERPETEIEDVHYALSAIRSTVLRIRFAGLGLFEQGRSRVVVAEATPDEALTRLRDKVTQAARRAGVPLDRERWRPHVTLARLHGAPTPEELERLRAFVARGARFAAGPFQVSAFELTRSRLGRAGAAYETMAVYPLWPEEPR